MSEAEQKSHALREVARHKRAKDQRNTISVVEPDMEDKHKRSPIVSAYLPSNRLRLANYSRDKSVRIYPSIDGKYKPRNVEQHIKLADYGTD